MSSGFCITNIDGSRSRLDSSVNDPLSILQVNHNHHTQEKEIQYDQEALAWATIQKLPSVDAIRAGLLKTNASEDSVVVQCLQNVVVDVTKLGSLQIAQLLQKILHGVPEEDNEHVLSKLRDRFDKVGIDLPRIEVRYQGITIETDAYVGDRAIPSLWNFMMNGVQENLHRLRLLSSRKQKLTILNNVSGILKPARMTLLLGPPGSGKTTLLQALAGRRLHPDLRLTGEITYNGHTFDEFVPQRTSAYVSQDDLHIGEMTVKETLNFSSLCQGVGARYDFLVELLRREKEAGIIPDPDIDMFLKAVSIGGQKTNIITDYVMKILGLERCADMFIGNDMLRGISGGQKKRVTTGEMLVGPARAMFMDDISTGLDSSTTYRVLKCLQQLAHLLDVTMMISLLQPASETFELFDDVVLLCNGMILYQGPRELVMDFFAQMGFICPQEKSIPDFLQEVISRKDQEQYWANRNEPYRFITAEEFSAAFKNFYLCDNIRKEIAVPFENSKSHPASLSKEKYGILSKREILKACLSRELLLMRRNYFLYIFKTAQISIISSVATSVFFRTRLHSDNVVDGNLYLGALFFGLMVVMFNGLAEANLIIDRLPVLFKERDQMFYPAWASSIPIFLSRIPLSLLESLIWVVLTYYEMGFAPEVGRFFKQFLLLFLLSQMAYSLFRAVAAIGRTMTVTQLYGALVLLVIFLLGGFVISRDDIPRFWIWVSWMSPMMYSQIALCVNEFLASRWNVPAGAIPNIGQIVLQQHGMFTNTYWFWIAICALVGFIVLFNVLFTVSIACLHPVSRPQVILPHDSWENQKTVHQAANLSTRNISESAKQTPSDISNADDMAKCDITSLRKGMVLPFPTLCLTFDKINYFVDTPSGMRKHTVSKRLQLLRDVSGAFRPGVLTALMGVSGAGKTTLMDVLAGRKTGGYIEGSISISGFPKNQETFARISGYCEQTDIHSPNVTVWESILFSAWSRLAKDIDKNTRMMFVEEVMELVELNIIKNSLVGIPGVNGLSTEQRKRLTIAVELVANPSIVFMDEPTTGLDARAAAIVMRVVRNTVNTGRTVVCTIHQPSTDIFEAFDELLLMKLGGQAIYVGPLGHKSHRLINYFESIPGVPKIKNGHNPATWMLEISSPSVEAHLGINFAEIYKKSSLFQLNEALIQDLSTPAAGSENLCFPTKFSQSFGVQLLTCLWKQNLSYWRNPDYNGMKILLTITVALLLGSIFWKLGSKMSSQQDVANIMGAIYTATIFLGITNGNSVQPVVDIERTVSYRERSSGMYGALSHALAQVLVEIPYAFLQTLLYGFIVFAMMDFPWIATKFLWFQFFMFCTFLYFTYYGMMMVALTPNATFATIISSFFYAQWNLFAGFIIPRMSIPVWWRWFYWANPVSWTLYGIISSQIGDLHNRSIETETGEEMTIPAFLEAYLGYRHDFVGVAAGVQSAMVVLFAVSFALCIRTFNFLKR